MCVCCVVCVWCVVFVRVMCCVCVCSVVSESVCVAAVCERVCCEKVCVCMQGSRHPFYLVDTIGVKFADEFAPTDEEMLFEFSLIRSQLKVEARPYVCWEGWGEGRGGRGKEAHHPRPPSC